MGHRSMKAKQIIKKDLLNSNRNGWFTPMRRFDLYGFYCIPNKTFFNLNDGSFDNEDAPSLIFITDTQVELIFFKDGDFHRDNAPAQLFYNNVGTDFSSIKDFISHYTDKVRPKYVKYYKNGLHYREDGPARIDYFDDKNFEFYALYNKEYLSKREWEVALKKLKKERNEILIFNKLKRL